MLLLVLSSWTIRSIGWKNGGIFCGGCWMSAEAVHEAISGILIAVDFRALSSNSRIVVPAGQKSEAISLVRKDSVQATLNEMNVSSSRERPRGASEAMETSFESLVMPSLVAMNDLIWFVDVCGCSGEMTRECIAVFDGSCLPMTKSAVSGPVPMIAAGRL